MNKHLKSLMRMAEKDESFSSSIKKNIDSLGRASSQSIKDIHNLYNTKPEKPKDVEYKRNIIEIAHPIPAVLFNTYDKLNGLIENENERQNITIRILNKVPNGNNTQHKYAENDLLLSLIRVGNDLELRKEKDLLKLADVCLKQANNLRLTKTAFAPGALLFNPYTAVFALITGAIYAVEHLENSNKGFVQNYKSLISEIDDLIKTKKSWGEGYDLKQDFKNVMLDFKARLTKFYQLYSDCFLIISELRKPRTKEELKEFAKSNILVELKKAHDALNAFMVEFDPYLNTIYKNLLDETYVKEQIEDTGWMTEMADYKNILHGGLINSDFTDVAKAIVPYKKSVESIIGTLADAKTKADEAPKPTDISEPSDKPKSMADQVKDKAKEMFDSSTGYFK